MEEVSEPPELPEEPGMDAPPSLRDSGGSEREVRAAGTEEGRGAAVSPSPHGFSPQRCRGGARAEHGGATADPSPVEQEQQQEQHQEAHPEPFPSQGRSSRKRPLDCPDQDPDWDRNQDQDWDQDQDQDRDHPGHSIPGTFPGSRPSWCRSSLRGRRSLPQAQRDITELSSSLSPALPEPQRLSRLLLCCFQFSLQELGQILKDTPGFNPEDFATKVQSLAKELELLLQSLEQDGTLQSCVEDPRENSRNSVDSSEEEALAQLKLQMARFSAEQQAWDQLLQQHQLRAQEAARQLQPPGPCPPLPAPCPSRASSQRSVLGTKPDYGRVLLAQGPELQSLELLLDETQAAVKVLGALSARSARALRELSGHLASRTFAPLAASPARSLLGVPSSGAPRGSRCR